MASAPFHWPQPSSLHSPTSSQTFASAISSPSSERRRLASGDARSLFCRYASSTVFPTAHRSCDLHSSRSQWMTNSQPRIIRRALSNSFNSFSDEEFSNKIIPADIERKANRFDIPISLRMIKRKKQWQGGITEACDSAYCSVKKAFSSMVFIIRELHSYTLQMRETLFLEDLQGVLDQVQKEMHASFVWLFQKVFSDTPTLMMYLMILLANYSVHSMSAHAALAAVPPVQACQVSEIEQASFTGDHADNNPCKQKFDSSIIKTLRASPSSNDGKTASAGGNDGGGGGKYRPVRSGMDDGGRFDKSNYGGLASVSMDNHPSSMSGGASTEEEEEALWRSMEDEASRMQTGSSDQETVGIFVAPVDARIEKDDRSEYLETDMFYRKKLAQEPENVLLLANYAQFLYLFTPDFDRAEEYFKRAAKVEPKDGEALNKYANFLWVVRNDIPAAEATYLEAISADPGNSYYAANYAHFLWNTGGEDTCFPLSPPDE